MPSATRSTVPALLTIIVVLVTLFALRELGNVFVPIVFGLFFVAAAWPLHRPLVRRLPSGAAIALSTLFFTLGAGGFVAALVGSGLGVRDALVARRDELERASALVHERAAAYGLSIGDASSPNLVGTLGQVGMESVAAFMLTVAFFSLGLVELVYFRKKLTRAFGAERAEAVSEIGADISRSLLRYATIRTFCGLLNGVLAGIASWMMGLELWWLWGLLAFLLNYIPTLGSVLATAPAVVFAFAQGGWSFALLVLAVLSIIQLVLGNWVDPLVQGRYMSLSPLAILIAISLFGWMWGIAGALIAIPLVEVGVIVMRRFDATRGLATMLTEWNEDSQVNESVERDREPQDKHSRTKTASGSVQQPTASHRRTPSLHDGAIAHD